MTELDKLIDLADSQIDFINRNKTLLNRYQRSSQLQVWKDLHPHADENDGLQAVSFVQVGPLGYDTLSLNVYGPHALTVMAVIAKVIGKPWVYQRLSGRPALAVLVHGEKSGLVVHLAALRDEVLMTDGDLHPVLKELVSDAA